MTRSDIKYQSVKTLNNERITLRLLQQCTGLIFERETVQADGWSQTQTLPLFCPTGALTFMQSDPCYPDLKQAYDQIYVKVQQHFHVQEA